VTTAWFNMSRTYGPGHRIHIVAKLDSGSSRPTIGAPTQVGGGEGSG